MKNSISNRSFDLFCVLTLSAAFLSFALEYLGLAKPQTVYVAASGSDVLGNGTRSRPYATVSKALRRIAIDGEIRLLPGVYRERIHIRKSGSSKSPLRLVADEPGSATISGTSSPQLMSRLDWSEIRPGLYHAICENRICVLKWKEQFLYRVPWGGLDGLLDVSDDLKSFGSFVQTGNELYVWHPDTKFIPSELVCNAHAPPPREWGEFKSSCLWIDADHVHIEGIRFEFGIGSCIRIWQGKNITIQDCSFEGAKFGVYAREDFGDVDQLTIRRCCYSNYPQGSWLGSNELTWRQVYAAYDSSTLIDSNGSNISVENCLASHSGDAYRISPRKDVVTQTSRIIDSAALVCTDDAFEFDGDASNLEVRRNLVYDCHESLGLSPVLEGPIKVTQSVFLHPVSGINGAQVKLTNPLAPDRSIRNIEVSNNCFVGKWLCWHDTNKFWNVSIHDNFFATELAEKSRFPQELSIKNNFMVNRRKFIDDYEENSIAALAENDETWAYLLDRKLKPNLRYGPNWLEPQSHPAFQVLSRFSLE